MPVHRWDEIEHKGGADALERARRQVAAEIASEQPAREDAATYLCRRCPASFLLVYPMGAPITDTVSVPCPACGAANELNAPAGPWRVLPDQ
jgi:hypothetical protein